MEEQYPNIAGAHPNTARRLRILLMITPLCFGVGLVAPVITLKKFALIESSFSVLSGVLALLQEGQLFLFIIIAAFSIVLYRLPSHKARKTAHLDCYLHWMRTAC
jgi:paraquat-inducible protein A